MRRTVAMALIVWGLPVGVLTGDTMAPAPTIELAERTVTVRGATPGGEVVWFAVVQESHQHTNYLYSRQGMAGAGADGVARVELTDGVPPWSIWFAVDLGTGRLAIGAPAAFLIRELPVAPEALHGSGALLELPLQLAYVLWVRPGNGAWWHYAGDGGASDQGPEGDGAIWLQVAAMRPLDGSPAPPFEVGPGDVLIMVDSQTLEYGAVELAEER